MFNRLINALPMGAIALAIFLASNNRVLAVPAIDYQDDLGQVTNVYQLRDVSLWLYCRLS